MSDLELCYLTASEALERFRKKKLSPVELMQAVIARAEKVQSKLKPFTYTHYDEALDLAKKAEAKYARGARTGALEGLPIAIKDESYIAGKPTSFGSLITKDTIPDTTSVNNQRILKAGGIVHARSATPEFSCASVTHSKAWGVTRNPWNPKFTPGGSSGGSGASLAAGSTSLAMGSDIGGSIRIPASACGVVGYKPPYGRNSDDPPFNLDPYCHTGPMTRSVADAILLQNVICGPSPTDIASLRPKLTLPTVYKPIKGWKIAYSIDLNCFEVDKEVVANTKAALDVFRSLGATVEEVDLKWGPWALETGLKHLDHLFGSFMAKMAKKHAKKMTAYALDFAASARKSTAADFLSAMEGAARMYETFGPMMETHDIFICPTLALPAVKAEFLEVRNEHLKINGKVSKLNAVLGWCMTSPFNTLSRCPVLSVPSGHAKSRVPTGIQIIGRTYSDADVFQAAIAFETAVGGWYRDSAHRPKL
ncbi:amidase [Dongia sedimenti]|uniref:Amidase n=1 Tax=Dongia sedimenti TaxID=3064282 RepID=A0ABU0YPQ8_9PROT|nr:amidase [Rhodospirillaceae bacterium R-7]